ncbi:MAG: CRISPR-associated helicase Cas3' [Candidatus Omnitrophota bacterium]|nr:CRISPR-associated helicase Cas3' [Candidatus Omnitrophota bacterium]
MKAYFRYWGKAEKEGNKYHPLVYHSLDVAAVGMRLADRLGIAKQIARRLSCNEKEIIPFITFLCAIHDIGKFSDGFQNQRPDMVLILRRVVLNAVYQEKHWSLGYRFLRENAGRIFDCDALTICDFLGSWFSASSGHHGRPPVQIMAAMPLVTQFPAEVANDAIEFILEARSLFGVPDDIPFLLRDETLMKELSWQVAGLMVLSDWLGSDKRWFSYCQEPRSSYEYWQQQALPQADRAISGSGVEPLASSKPACGSEIFEHIRRVTPLQRLVENIVIHKDPGLFIMEEITGAGKTEAALILTHRLIAAGHAEGIYFGLPTMATANAMHERVEKVYRKFYADKTNPALILAHSASRQCLALENNDNPDTTDANEDAGVDARVWLYDNRKKALLAHVGVGTIDQALLAVLPARHQSLRLFGLHGKVLIVDEVHAYDSYMNKLLCTLLTFHAAQGGNVILLSATLPQIQRKAFFAAFAEGRNMDFDRNVGISVQYPLVSGMVGAKFIEEPIVSPKYLHREVVVTALYEKNEIGERIETAVKSGKNICWLRNTVFDAQEAYEALNREIGVGKVTLFHARFALGDRLLIEKQIIQDFGAKSGEATRSGKAVIATQVVEQSLDIDFDFMVTDLAPIDLIIQRAGRLCRHSRDAQGNRIDARDKRGTSELLVYMPWLGGEITADWYKSIFPKAAGVYEHHGQLWLTARWLVENKKFRMPQDARSMVESVYAESVQSSIPQALERQENRAGGKDKAKASMGQFQTLKLKEGYLPDGLKWAEDEKAPTRIGDVRTTVRLAVWNNGVLVPYFRVGQGNDWMLSEVSVSQYRIKSEDETNRKAIDDAKNRMPDKGKYCVIVALQEHGEIFTGTAVNARGELVTVLYDTKRGLRVKEQGETDESDS